MNYTMSNDELVHAIEAAWSRVNKTSATMEYYKPAVELYKELQLELLRRARESREVCGVDDSDDSPVNRLAKRFQSPQTLYVYPRNLPEMK